jgi:hypothetical protein
MLVFYNGGGLVVSSLLCSAEQMYSLIIEFMFTHNLLLVRLFSLGWVGLL